jgi:hypothetical protein
VRVTTTVGKNIGAELDSGFPNRPWSKSLQIANQPSATTKTTDGSNGNGLNHNVVNHHINVSSSNAANQRIANMSLVGNVGNQGISKHHATISISKQAPGTEGRATESNGQAPLATMANGNVITAGKLQYKAGTEVRAVEGKSGQGGTESRGTESKAAELSKASDSSKAPDTNGSKPPEVSKAASKSIMIDPKILSNLRAAGIKQTTGTRQTTGTNNLEHALREKSIENSIRNSIENDILNNDDAGDLELFANYRKDKAQAENKSPEELRKAVLERNSLRRQPDQDHQQLLRLHANYHSTRIVKSGTMTAEEESKRPQQSQESKNGEKSKINIENTINRETPQQVTQEKQKQNTKEKLAVKFTHSDPGPGQLKSKISRKFFFQKNLAKFSSIKASLASTTGKNSKNTNGAQKGQNQHQPQPVDISSMKLHEIFFGRSVNSGKAYVLLCVGTDEDVRSEIKGLIGGLLKGLYLLL